jgi:hypothetical protein
MQKALAATANAYGSVTRTVSRFFLVTFGLAYIVIGGMVIWQCWPKFSMKHVAYWQSDTGIIIGIGFAAVIGELIFESKRHLPHALRGGWIAVGFGFALFYWTPTILNKLNNLTEPAAALAFVLLILGVMNICEAMPAGGNSGSHHGTSRLANPKDLRKNKILIYGKR